MAFMNVPDAESPIEYGENEHKKNITIILADDHSLIRKALIDIFNKQPNLEVIAEADNGDTAVKLASEKKPDIIIMDISMPGLNGLEATRQIKASHPEINILVLTIHDEMEHILGILEAGADGYLMKNVSEDEIVLAVNALVLGETILSPSVSQKIYKYAFQFVTRSVDLDKRDKLSVREMELLKLLAKGLSNKDIALRLHLSLRTVKSYLADLFSKIEVTSRTEAVIISLRKGILTIEDLD
jgi:two-component system, NarL family, response regulator LiaR